MPPDDVLSTPFVYTTRGVIKYHFGILKGYYKVMFLCWCVVTNALQIAVIFLCLSSFYWSVKR